MKKSKEDIMAELQKVFNKRSIYVDFQHSTGQDMLATIDDHVKFLIEDAVEVIIDNAYNQTDFEKDVGVRDEHEEIQKG